MSAAPSDAEATIAVYFPRTPRSPAPLSECLQSAIVFILVDYKLNSVFDRINLDYVLLFTMPIGPPLAASGVICPTSNPWLPPENRPS